MIVLFALVFFVAWLILVYVLLWSEQFKDPEGWD